MIVRRPRTVVAVLAAALLATACGGGDDDAGGDPDSTALPDQVTVAFQTIPNGAPIVKHNGWLEEALGDDVTVEWRQFSSGAEVNQAVASGAVDLGLTGSSPLTAGIAQDLPYRTVWIYDVLGDNEALVARDEAGISSVADLRGTTVGTPFGSTTHYSLLSALSEEGISADELSILDMQPQDALAAWQRGDIDAAYVWVPVLAEMRDDGGTVIVSSGDLAEMGYLTADLGIVSEEFADTYPEAVRSWLEQEERAVQLYLDDPDAAAEAVAAEFELDVEEARSQMDELVWVTAEEQASADYFGTTEEPGAFVDALEATGAFLEEQDLVPTAPSREALAEAVDPSFLPAGS